MSDAPRPESSSSTVWRIGGRYLNRKTRQRLTLRYVGTLPSATNADTDTAKSQVWLGVEYDDPSHGKGHSGTFEDVQVFQTQQAGAGAFIRLKKGDELEQGTSLVQAIKERYGLLDQTTALGESSRGVSLGTTGIVVETPGLVEVEKRLRRLDKLREIGLEGQHVSSVGGDEAERSELRKRLKGVTLLDISRNLFESWGQVAEIMDVLPGLKTVIINDSRLALLSPDEPKGLSNLGRLKELHIARSCLNWDTLCELGAMLGGLEELYVGDNPLGGPTSSDFKLRDFEHLKLLSLESCGLASWTGVETALFFLPKLETLNVSSNPLSVDCSSETKPVLTSLRNLVMLSTPVASVRSLATLSSRTPNVQALKYSLDPSLPLDRQADLALTGHAPADRAALIALFPTLDFLNGTVVKSKEREEAERRYLDILSKSTRPKEASEEWLRHDVLAHKHGLAVRRPPPPAVANSQSLRSKMITLHVYAVDAEAASMSVLPTAPIALLRRKIAKKLERPVANVLLYTVRRTQTGHGSSADSAQVWANEKVVQVEDGEVGFWFDDGDGVLVE